MIQIPSVGASGIGRIFVWTATALGALAVGSAIAVRPEAVVAAATVGCGALLMLVNGRMRVLGVVFVGLFALQSSEELDTWKFVYMATVSLAVVVAVFRLFIRIRPSALVVRIGLRTLPFIVVLLGSFFVSQANGTPLASWLRDAAPYMLFAVAPILAIDAASSTSAPFLRTSMLAAGLIACASFSVEWLGRRDIAALPVSHLGLPSGQLLMALFSLAFAAAFIGRHQRPIWGLAGVIVLIVILATGTRSALVVLFSPLAIAFLNRGHSLSRNASMLGGLTALLLIATLAVPVVAPVVGLDLNRIDDRITSIARLASDPESDASYVERVRQFQADWEVFEESPLLGAGPGRVIEWTTAAGQIRMGYDIDSPIGLVSKLGIVGLLAAGFSLTGWLSLIRTRPLASQVPALALTGVLVVGLASTVLLLGIPLDDKGFSLAIVLLLGLLIVESKSPIKVSPQPAVLHTSDFPRDSNA